MEMQAFSNRAHELLMKRALRRKAKTMQLTDPEMIEFIEQVIYGLQKPLDFRVRKDARMKIAEEILFKIAQKKII
jgi:hypothetical protein